MRNFQKLKTVKDYEHLDAPEKLYLKVAPIPDSHTQQVLRVLVRPKYGMFVFPRELKWIEHIVRYLSIIDVQRTGIKDSWCYVTIRHGEVMRKTDDEWHFDGSSFRTDIIPERNYIWVDHTPTEYKVGRITMPEDFDPIKHDLFRFAANQLKNAPIHTTKEKTWYLLSPFVLHRRPKITNNKSRTFIRICFTDIEGRDINNTQNSLLPTPFFGRDPVKTFRNNLIDYGQ